MLGRGVKHELLLLRFLGKVPKSGETTTYAPAILQTRVENCWDLPVHSVATVVNPSEGLEVQRIARRLFGSLAGRSPSLTSGTKLRDHELGVRNRLGRWMTTDLENCSTREGISAKAKDDVSNAGGSSPSVENTAPTTEDSTATGADFISQGEDRFVFDAEFADPKDLHAKAEGFSISDELVTEGNMVMADSGGTSQTTPEDLLTNLDDKVEDPKKLDSFAPIFSKAVEEFQQARGHPAKVYVHIKSLEKIKPGQLANVRSAGLPVKRSLYTVNRSPHVDKKARDQFEMKVHRHLLVIETETHRLHQKLTELKNHDLPGVQLKVTFQYQTRLDRSLLG